MEPSRRAKPTKSIPITGLSLYVDEQKKIMEAEYPELTRMDIYKMLHAQWDEMDPDSRAKYERRADYVRRTEARKEFYQKKKVRSGDGPLRAISAFSMFLKKRHIEIKECNPELTLTERVKHIGAEWNSMSRADKQPFVNMAKRETRKIRKGASDEAEESTSEEA